MDRFKTVRKGYDKAEVDEFIARADKQKQNVLSEQAMRIEELKARVERLEKENDAYKAKENSVNEALLSAVEKANEIDGTAKIRFALEGERIKIFEGKWISYCKKTMQSLKTQNEMEKFLESVDAEIAGLMNEELNVSDSAPARQYAEEKTRLAKKRQKIAAEHKDRIGDEENIFTYDPPEEKAQFNLDELENPPTLADLCRQLGL